jgi:dihydroxy-acid dehydratase
MRSDIIKLGLDKSPQRAMLKGMGYINEEIANPFIGIVCSYSEISPGHSNLRQLAQAVKDGVRLAGGTPLEVDTVNVCDGIALGHEGTNYALASRELVADTVETIIGANGFDAVVLVSNCEKMVSGMLMGATRLDLPTIVVCGGVMPIASGSGMAGVFQSLRAVKKGQASIDELFSLEDNACAGCGACAGVPDANASSIAAEALGMALPRSSTCTAGYAELYRLAKQAGMKIMELLARNLRPSQVITEKSLINALSVDAALGGSPNTILHLRALARELNMEITADMINDVMARTPVLCQLSPSSNMQIADLHQAGGIPAILKSLSERNLIREEALAVTGKTINSSGVTPFSHEPVHSSANLAVITGNLAPDGSIITWEQGQPPMINGCARVFDSEQAAEEAFSAGSINVDDIVVIRYEGPRGGPGMRELASPGSILDTHPLSARLVYLSDGRFSRWRKGVTVQQISPEAAAGGPLAAIADGDRIAIDATAKSINVELSPQDFSRRLKGWSPPSVSVKSSYLAKYARLVSSAAAGAITK